MPEALLAIRTSSIADLFKAKIEPGRVFQGKEPELKSVHCRSARSGLPTGADERHCKDEHLTVQNRIEEDRQERWKPSVGIAGLSQATRNDKGPDLHDPVFS